MVAPRPVNIKGFSRACNRALCRQRSVVELADLNDNWRHPASRGASSYAHPRSCWNCLRETSCSSDTCRYRRIVMELRAGSEEHNLVEKFSHLGDLPIILLEHVSNHCTEPMKCSRLSIQCFARLSCSMNHARTKRPSTAMTL